MSPPPPDRIHDTTPEAALRLELAALADALVDARPSDHQELRARVRHAAEAHRRSGRSLEELGRLLHQIMYDLSREAASLDTIYYARQLVVVAERLPN